MELQEFLDTLHSIENTLKSGDELIDGGYLAEFSREVKNIEENAAEIINEKRNLKIGIIGGVKAGKSSFLNALVFDGDRVLPESDTPMTAALTRIVYSEKPYARVTFFDDDDWETIKYNAERFDKELKKLEQEELKRRRADYEKKLGVNGKKKVQHMEDSGELPPYLTKLNDNDIARLKNSTMINSEYRTCKQLKEMTSDEVLDQLGQEIKVPVTDVYKSLAEYAGSKGKFTPIVKYIELGLDNPMLKDLEIIDTPGLNDPVSSRSAVTQNYLIHCDVVFLLSVSSSFLTEQDISFISKSLPSSGINNAMLVCSKFDSALLDEKATTVKGKLPFNGTVRSVARNLQRDAKRKLEEAQKYNLYGTNKAIQEIEKSVLHYYITSILYDAGKKLKQGEPLNPREAHVVKQLKDRFEGFKDTADFLMGFSGIKRIREEVIPECRKNKDKILEERGRDFIRNQHQKFVDLLDTAQRTAWNNLEQVQNVDKEGLQKRIKRINRALESARSGIDRTFQSAAVKAGENIHKIEDEINKDRGNFRDVKVETKVTTREGYYTRRWIIFKTWHPPVSEKHKYVSLAEALRNIGDCVYAARSKINDELKTVVNRDDIKKSVRTDLLLAFNESNTEFEENDILGPVDLYIRKITFPEIEVDAAGYQKMITSSFRESFVKDDEIYALQMKEEEVLDTICKDFENVLEDKRLDIENRLNGAAKRFIDDIQDRLKENNQKVAKQLDDREASIQNYEKFIEQIKGAKKILDKAGNR